MTIANRLCALLNIDVPVLLGPFGGLSSIDLTATVSNLGGLGAYGLYGYDAERIAATAQALRAATDRPFALNAWLPTGDEVTPEGVDLEPYRQALAPLFAAVDVEPPDAPAAFLPSFDEQVAAMLAARPAAVSFVYGVPPAEVVRAAHAAGIAVIGAATTVAEAVALEAGGVDVIVATGAEAAGHRVSFLRPAADSLVGTFTLVPQVVDAVGVPVVAAGGIADRRGVAAAFALGAAGVQVGTAFLATRQSAASDAYRSALRAASADQTCLTRAMSGRLSRGLPNRAVRTIEATGSIAPFPAQNWLTGQFRSVAARAGRADLVSLWAGQGAPLARLDDAGAVLAELTAGVPGAIGGGYHRKMPAVRASWVGEDPLAVDELARRVADRDRGAIATFAGVVRDHDHGRTVEALHYEGHPSAEVVLAEVAAEVAVEFDVLVAVAHRVGDLRIGEVALGAAVAAAHRGPAFAACGALVDRVKDRLPVWKYQRFTDGTHEWVNCA